MTDMVPAVTARANAEAARIQQLIDAQQRRLHAAAVGLAVLRRAGAQGADYAFDESQVRPYFELERVLRDGVFFAATRLYGITFKERRDLPVYHPDVRVFEVFDRDGSGLGLFYTDYFARPAKRGGGWTNSFVSQSRLLGTKTVTTNTCNFPKPAPGRSGAAQRRRSDDDVPRVRPRAEQPLLDRAVSGDWAALPRDFGEVPSQFNEHWALEPTVFANYAKHYKTGEPMPAGARGEDPQGVDVQPGVRHRRTAGRGAARHGMAHAAACRPGAGRRRVRSADARALPRRAAGDSAALQLALFRAHLGQRLFRRLLLVPVERRSSIPTPTTGSGSMAG